LVLSLRNRLDGRIDIELLNEGQWQRSSIGPFQGKKLGAGENRLEMSGADAAEGVRLVFVGGEGSSAEITEVQPIGSGVGYTWGPAIRLAYPLDGEYYGDSAYVRAFVQPFDNGSGPAAITVAGTAIDSADGAIEALVSKAQAGFGDAPDSAPWSFEIEALYPDGQRLLTTVQLYRHGDGSLVVAPRYNPALSAYTGSPFQLEHDEGMLDLDGDSMDESPSSLTISSLSSLDLPPLDPGMTNVTKGPRKGYRFGPHGKKFKKNIQVKLPYDTNKLPPGMTEADIRTYYFDEDTGHWRALERVNVDDQKKEIVSHTNHFTDMINATIVVPDHPEAASFNPTQIKDIKAADPGAGINLIEPPQANNRGDANLSYPIEIPPGRGGMQPQLAIQYNSGGGNGWLGLGWDLSVPSFSVDTRWGVPRYDADKESETYLFNGAQLIAADWVKDKEPPLVHRATDWNALADRDPTALKKAFRQRVEGSYSRITRHGASPDTYWWEVQEKNGTISYYGGDENGQIAGAVIGGSEGVFRWMLVKTVDLHGNSVEYQYDAVCDTGVGSGECAPDST
ncbi:MAG TPA: hypothetical protein ENO14_04480, partial [Chromatiales bacterium]|nr:hypothetical protein [Chromatiales bacterium]